MRITNKFGLSPQLVSLVTRSQQRPPDMPHFRVTGLVKPPQLLRLEREHWDELETDASDLVFALYGSLVHQALGQFQDGSFVEERLTVELDGCTISGAPDLVTEASQGTYELRDWKFTAIPAAAYDGIRPEWEQQVNVYAYLLAEHGFPVSTMAVEVLYRDWKPHAKVPRAEVIPVNIWPREETLAFLHQRLALHMAPAARCTDEDRWHRPDTWALARKGVKRALKLFPEEALAHADATTRVKPGQQYERFFDITFRPGEDVRCMSYCNVAAVCPQFKEAYVQEEEVPDL